MATSDELRVKIRRMITENDHKSNDSYRASDWFMLAALTTELLNELDKADPVQPAPPSEFKIGEAVTDSEGFAIGIVGPLNDWRPGLVRVTWRSSRFANHPYITYEEPANLTKITDEDARVVPFQIGDRVSSLRSARDGTVVSFPENHVHELGTTAVHWDGRGPGSWSTARDVNIVKIKPR